MWPPSRSFNTVLLLSAKSRTSLTFGRSRPFTTARGLDSPPEKSAAELYDIVIVGGGPAGCALAGALGSSAALADARIALIDPGKLADARQWEPPADTYLARTLQITSSSKRYLDSLGLWDQCFADRVQPYDRAIVTDALGHGRLDLEGASFESSADGHAAYMIETKNLVGGLLRALCHKGGHCRVDMFERAKVVGINTGEVAFDWPVVTLSTKKRLQARLLVGTDGASSFVRKHAQIGTYGNTYGQYGLVATLCLEQLNQTAFQRFLPTGPIALLPFPGGFANLVWSLDSDLVQVLKAVPEDAFASLVNAAFRLSPPEMEYLYGVARAGAGAGAGAGEVKTEVEWRLRVHANSHSGAEPWLPPTIAATSSRSRMSFPLHMRLVDRLVAERVALVGDAGHVMHPLAGQGLNMGLEDVRCLAAVLEQAVLAGEDIGTLAVLNRYNKQRYIRNLAMQGAVDKIWHIFGASASPVVRARSLLMNALDDLPSIKRHLVKGGMGEERLLSACMMDQSGLVKELLSAESIDVNHVNGLGYTALHYAARTASIDCVKLLVAVPEINPNMQDSLDKDTPLHKALIHCEESEDALLLTKLLLDAGSDPRIMNKKLQRAINLVEPEEEDIHLLLLRATLAFDSRPKKSKDSDDKESKKESDVSSCSSD